MTNKQQLQAALDRLYRIEEAANLVRRYIGFDTRIDGQERLMICVDSHQSAALAIKGLWHALRAPDDHPAVDVGLTVSESPSERTS